VIDEISTFLCLQPFPFLGRPVFLAGSDAFEVVAFLNLAISLETFDVPGKSSVSLQLRRSHRSLSYGA
jgi:hypothetical protein